MKKPFFFIVVIICLLTASMPVFAQAKSESRNQQDTIRITKIAPRGLSFLPKPVNMPFHMEIEYDLKTQDTGNVAVYFFKVTRRGAAGALKMEEVPGLKKVYPVKKGKASITHISSNITVAEKDPVVEIYAVTSLVDSKGKELAFSTSKNIINGTYRIIQDKNSPERNSIRQLGVVPRPGTEIQTGRTTPFDIQLQYSLQSQELAFIDILFMDRADLGTGLCWNSATITIPKGTGKLIIRPEIYLDSNFSGHNMGIGIVYWLNPLRNSQFYLKIVDYFIK